jgi:hypothetical protein
MRVTRQPIWIAGGILLVSCFALLLVFRPTRPALVVVSSDPRITVSSVLCTFGTNHMYCYEGTADRITDWLIPSRLDKNAAWLHWHTSENSTVVWVRFVHPSYGVPRFRGAAIVPPSVFTAHIIGTNGAVTLLKSLDTCHQDFHSQSLVTGWEMPGQLKAHSGSTIRVDEANGIGSVRVP